EEDSCNACGESGNLLIYEMCTYEYHPLKASLPIGIVNSLNDIEKILDSEMRPTVADERDASKFGSMQLSICKTISC
nr:hypothetical protein [Tanacetum cinerariifolium]